MLKDRSGGKRGAGGTSKTHIGYILDSDVDILKGTATYKVVEAYDEIDAEGFGEYKNDTVYRKTFNLSEIDHHEKIKELRKKWGIKK